MSLTHRDAATNLPEHHSHPRPGRTGRRRFTALAAAAGAAIVCAALAGPALAHTATSASVNAPGPNHAHPNHLTVSWRMTGLTQQDLGTTGESSGDTLQATYLLTSQPGSGDYACTLAGAKQYVCTGVVHLRRGDIYVAVAARTDSDPAAIIGGTGAYRAARGEYTQIEKTEQSGSWTFTFTQ